MPLSSQSPVPHSRRYRIRKGHARRHGQSAVFMSISRSSVKHIRRHALALAVRPESPTARYSLGHPPVQRQQMTPPRPIIRLNCHPIPLSLTCLPLAGQPRIPPMPGSCTGCRERGGQPASPAVAGCFYEALIPRVGAMVRSVPGCACTPLSMVVYLVLVFASTNSTESSPLPAGWAMTSGDRG